MANDIRVEVRNFPDGGCLWPKTDRWYGRLVVFFNMQAPHEVSVLFCDYSGNIGAIKVIEVTTRSRDGSWSAPAKPRTPYDERRVGQWRTAEGSWMDILRFRRYTFFLEDGLVWGPAEKRRKPVMLTIRFQVRRKTGEIEEYGREIRLRRIVLPVVYPVPS